MKLNAEEVKQMRKLLFCHICEATGLEEGLAKTLRRFEKNFSLCFVTTQVVFFCNCEPLWVFASSGLSVVNWESMCGWRGRSASKSMHCSRGGLESGFRHWWFMTTHYFSSRRSHAIVLPLWAPHIHFYNTPIYIYI